MNAALVIGATGFVGSHAVLELLDHGYDVTTLSRHAGDHVFDTETPLEHITGDRTEADTVLIFSSI